MASRHDVKANPRKARSQSILFGLPATATDGSARVEVIDLETSVPVQAEPLDAAILRMDVVGYVEEVIELGGIRHLKGWAFDHGNPAQPLWLTVFIDGQPFAKIVCDLPRADLLAAGLARDNSGFLWPVPAGLSDGRHHGLTVQDNNSASLPFIHSEQSYDSLWQLNGDLESVAEALRDIVMPPPRKADWAVFGPPAAPTAPALLATTSDLPPQPDLFDAKYYLATNPEIAGSGLSAWAHFVTIGAAERRNPCLLFDVGHYLEANSPLPNPSENPLLHFERTGRAERRSHHWLFNEAEYLRLNPDLPPEIDLLHHILAYGLAENRRPSVLFDPPYYLTRYPDVALAGIPAFEHFLLTGDAEGRAPHCLFDADYYRAEADVPPGAGALEHYVHTAGRCQPHPLFDGAFYRGAHADAVAAYPTPLHHYIETGAARGYDPHPAFQTAHYLRLAMEPAARLNPLQHYLTVGQQAGLSPNPLFDPSYYAAQPIRRTWDDKALPRTGPRISVIVPVYNTPPQVLKDCIDSVLAQTYTSWELCIVDDGSRSPGTAATLAAYRGRDPRIRIDRSVTNLHIARATNRAVLQATGEFVAFLDHDDTIEPNALAEIAAALIANPEIDLLYTDEDKLDHNGERTEPYFKPDWSPEHLNSVMYVLHMLVVRKSLFWSIGGSRPERAGAQDYDLALRAAAKARCIHHVPRILYHWRMMEGSTAGDQDAKPYALEAARSALQDIIAPSMPGARVEDGLLRGTFRVRPSLAARPPVTLLILTSDVEREIEQRGRINLVRNFIESIANTSTYDNYRLVVVDDANSSSETKQLVKRVGGKIVQYRRRGQFNYAHKANFATRAATTDHIIHLNDDMEIIAPGWIEALLELSTQPDVGGVGARLLYPNGCIQHSGIVLGVNGAAGHAFFNLTRETIGYNAYTHLIRNYSAVTGAVFATRRSVLDEVGGYDERLAIDFNDVDLCLRIGQTGRRIAFTPYAELFHFEGSTAARTTQNPEERALFTERWDHLIARDPFYNPNLPRDRLGFA